MTIKIVYTVECGSCDKEAETEFLDTTNPQEDGSLRIDLEMVASQQSFECPECGEIMFTGDLDVFKEEN